MHKFPENFLWGTASSAHQIEGNNIHSDWWMWEQTKKYPNDPDRKYPLEPSGLACDSYNRYEEDLDYCVDMHNNAIRFGVEWARIEPEEGVFDQNQIEHYKRVIAAAKARGLKVMITLHHFSSPLWFANKGGWVSWNCAHLFARYAKRCAQEFGDTVDLYATINEPQVYVLMSYIRGIWNPGKKNPLLASIVTLNFIRSHRAAYDAIKSVNPNLKIGIVKHIVWIETAPSENKVINFLNRWYAKLIFFLMTDFFLKPLGKKQDFIGLNYYFTEIYKNFKISNPDDLVSDMGWWIHPQGLENILLFLKKYNLPIYVTENGLADADDKIRKEFLLGMLLAVHGAIEKGANVKGYFYWTLIDNYELHEGFWPRFGLIEVNRSNNLERIMRPSATLYGEIAKNNAIDL